MNTALSTSFIQLVQRKQDAFNAQPPSLPDWTRLDHLEQRSLLSRALKDHDWPLLEHLTQTGFDFFLFHQFSTADLNELIQSCEYRSATVPILYFLLDNDPESLQKWIHMQGGFQKALGPIGTQHPKLLFYLWLKSPHNHTPLYWHELSDRQRQDMTFCFQVEIGRAKMNKDSKGMVWLTQWWNILASQDALPWTGSQRLNEAMALLLESSSCFAPQSEASDEASFYEMTPKRREWAHVLKQEIDQATQRNIPLSLEQEHVHAWLFKLWMNAFKADSPLLASLLMAHFPLPEFKFQASQKELPDLYSKLSVEQKKSFESLSYTALASLFIVQKPSTHHHLMNCFLETPALRQEWLESEQRTPFFLRSLLIHGSYPTPPLTSMALILQSMKDHNIDVSTFKTQSENNPLHLFFKSHSHSDSKTDPILHQLLALCPEWLHHTNAEGKKPLEVVNFGKKVDEKLKEKTIQYVETMALQTIVDSHPSIKTQPLKL